MTQEKLAVTQAEQLLRSGKCNELLLHCLKYVDQYPSNISLWKLLGVAHGSSGNAKGARLSFLTALQLNPTDAITLGNYITACFDCGDKAAALQGIDSFYTHLDYPGQKIVLASLLEAVRTNLVSEDELPDFVKGKIDSM